MTRYPRWKGFLVLAVTLLASLSALPNFYGADRALQITTEDGSPIDESALIGFTTALEAGGIEHFEPELQDGIAVIRFIHIEEQLQGSELLKNESPTHIVAFTIEGSTGLTMIDFWAEWCGPCRMVAPIVEALADEYSDEGVTVGKLDVDQNPDVTVRFAVRSIPSVLFFKDGEHVDTVVGAVPRPTLEAKIKEHM